MFEERISRAGGPRALALSCYLLADAVITGLGLRWRGAMRATWRWIRPDDLARELLLAARALRRAPGFALVAVATMGLGIGAATTTFSALDRALWQPLPYPNQDRLAVLAETRRGNEISVAWPNFSDWQSQSTAFEQMAAFRGRVVTLGDSEGSERVRGQIVTSSLFPVLGVAPAVGRVFTAEDDRPGARATVILGHALWQRQFGGDRSIIGRSVLVDRAPFEVIGVMPPGFDFPAGVVYGPAEAYLAHGTFWNADLANRGSHPGLVGIGLLRPGVTLETGRAELTDIAARLSTTYPENREIGVLVRDAVTVIVGDLRDQLQAVSAGAAALLLVACANVAGLVLARALSRRRELSVRAALGASRAMLVRTLVAEHIVLAIASAGVGMALASTLTWLIEPLTSTLPRLQGLRPDAGAFGLAVALSASTGIVFGLSPMLRVGQASADPDLKQRGQSAGGWRLRQVLLGTQMAIAAALLVIALLLSSSLYAELGAPTGITPAGALTTDISLPEATYPTDERRTEFFERFMTALAQDGRITAAGGISTLPFSGSGSQTGVRPRGGPDDSQVRTDVAVVTRGYFNAMGVPLVQGRTFDDRDRAGAPAVAVVDERFAARLFPGRNAVGQHVEGWGFPDLEIIGVVGHVKNYGRTAPSREELYVHHPQRPVGRLTAVARTRGEPHDLATAIRQAVAVLDRTLPVSRPSTMQEMVDRTVSGPRLAATISNGFGLLALILATVGLYALVTHAVELRRREAGIRLALGASPARVIAALTSGTVLAALVGIAAGLCGGALGGYLLRHQLVGISPTDAPTLALSAAALVTTALAAGWWPARRVSRVPPAIVLEDE